MKSLLPQIKERLHFHATKIRQHPFVVDNISRGKAHLLVLSKKIKNAVPTKAQTRNFWREHHHRMVYIAIFFIFCAITIHLNVHADVSSVNMYSANCVGDWQHPELASGVPDVTDGSTNFSAENSAVASGSPSSITCRNFSGNIPDGVVPQKFVVHLSWIATADPIEDVNTMVQDDAVSAPSQDSLPATDATSASVPDAIATPVATTSTSDVSAPSSNGGDADASSTPDTSVDTSADTSTTTSSLTATSTDATSTSDTSDTTSVVAPIAMTADLPQQDFLELKYTLDGEHWNSLGTVNAANAKNISFEIQNTDISKWSDLSNMQISVGTLLPDSELPHIYLDSVYVEADYAPIPKIINPPVISLKDDSAVLDGKSDFASDETPTFIVTDPGLTTGDIQTLVDTNQAQVIEDYGGVINTTSSSATSSGVDLKSSVIDSVIQNVEQKVQDTTNTVTSFVTTPIAEAETDSATIEDAQVLDAFGNKTDIPVSISDVVVNGIQKQQISITKPSRAFRPGKYTLQLSLNTAQAIIVSKQDFTWGVLTINTNKSIYSTGDTAFLQMGVINDLGHTICNADLVLIITAPNGTTYPYASANNSIKESGDCVGDTYVTTPDYFAHFLIPNIEGDYTMSLTATTDNGVRTVESHFAVNNNAKFDVVRTGPTRIYPVDAYPVSLQITSPADWNGIVVERVPSVFDISSGDFSQNYDSVATSSDGASKIISWSVNLQANKQITIGYNFNAPKLSPQFYLLGPLKFEDDSGRVVFSETRQWQIADDAACTATISGTWNTVNTGGMWSGCTGTGGVPGTADDVTINPSVTVTLGAATPVVNSITVNGLLDTSLSNYALNAKSLSVPLGGKLSANASVITISGTTNTVLSLAGTFGKGTSTMTLTGGSTATTIPAVSYYNLTLNNSLDTYNLTGTTTIDPGGTLTVTNGTLNTTVSNYSIIAGRINIASAATAIITANGSTITLNGTTGALFTKGALGVFNSGTSTIVMNPDSAITLFGGAATVNNLTLSPVLTANRIYTFSGGIMTINGNFNITPSGTGLLTVNMTSGVTSIVVAAAKTFLLQPSGSATVYFDTVAVAQSISTGILDIEPSATLNISGGSAITLTGTNGTPFIMNGTFNAGTGTVTYTGDNSGGNTTIATTPTYYNVTFNNTTETYVLGANLTTSTSGTLTITAGTFDTSATGNYSVTTGKIVSVSAASAILNFNGSTITLGATSGTLFTKGVASILNAASSTLDMNPDAAVTLFSAAATVNNVTINPVLSTNRIYTISGGAMVINGNFNITPSGTGLLTVNMSNGITTIAVSAAKTFLLQPSGSATVYFDTGTNAGQTISTGILDVELGATLNVGSTTSVTLTGTTGTPFVMNGTFNAGTGTVIYSGNNASGNTTIATTPTYYNLTINNTSEIYVLGGNLTTSAAGTITITLGTLDTSSTGNYSVTTGHISIASNTAAILNLNGSTATLNGTTGTLLTKGSAGILNAGTSTIIMNPDAAVALFSNAVYTLNNLTVNPAITTSRADTFGAGVTTFTGNFVINPSGTGTLTITMNAGLSSFVLGATNSLTISGSGSAAAVLDTTAAQAITTGILDIEAGGTFNENASTITLVGTNGTPFIMNGTFNAGTGTIAYTGDNASGSTTIATTPTYYNININKTGETFILGGTLNGLAAGTLTITAGSFDTTSSNYAINFGHLSVGSTGVTFLGNASTVTLNGTSGILYARSNISTITTPNMNVVVKSDAGVTLFTTGGVYTFNNLTLSPALTASRAYLMSTPVLNINNFSVTPSAVSASTLTVTMSTSAVTIGSSGTFLLQPSGSALVYFDTSTSNPGVNTGALDIEANATFNSNASVITISGTTLTPFIMNGTFNQGTSTVSFTGTSTNAAIPAITFYNLTLNKTGSMVLTGTTTVVTAGTLTITAGTFDTSASGNYSLSVGHITMTAATSIFNANASTVTLTGITGTLFSKVNASTFNQGTSEFVVTSASGTPSLLLAGSVNCAFYKLTINSTATVISTVGTLVMSNATAGNRLWIEKGVLSDNGIQIVGTTNGTIQIDSAGALCIGAGGITNAACNNSTSAVATGFPTNYTNANIILDPASTVYYNGNVNMTVSSVPTYGNLYFAPLLSSSRAYTVSGALLVNGNLSVIPNTATAGAYSLTLSLGGVTTVASTKKILVQGGGASPVTAVLDPTTSNYAFSTGSLDIEASGVLMGRASTITIANNWTNVGTFTSGSSTVIFNTGNTAVVSGTTTFYKLTISNTTAKEVDFDPSNSAIYNVTNLFSVPGQASGVIKLRSVTPGTKWEFYPTGTSNVTYVDVQDGGCNTGSITIVTTAGTNSGNNDACWGFFPFITFSLSSGSVGFGSLTSLGARYATSDGTGSSTDVEGNNITVTSYAAGGYTLTVQGYTPSYGNYSLAAMGNSNIASIPGVEQFGIRAIATGGSGAVQAPYSGSSGTGGFATTASTTPSIIASESSGDGIPTTYSMHYIANISPVTPAGKYTTTLTYILTGTF